MTGLHHYPPIWLHRVPASFKLLALATLSIFILQIENLFVLSVALAAVATFYFAHGVHYALRLKLVAPLWPVMLAIFTAQYFTSGVDAAIILVLRMVLMILLADIVTSSTPMQAMMDAMIVLMRPFRFSSTTPHKISFCVALTIRFVPLLLDLWRQQSEAWHARTGRRPSWRLIAPYLTSVLRMADRLAESLDARGFGSTGPNQ
jgi:biotin transport system permease protein